MAGETQQEPGRTAAVDDPVDRQVVPPVDDERAHACLPVAACGIDTDGVVRSWNLAAERLLGWTAGEVLGRPAPFLGPGSSLVDDLADRPGLLAGPTRSGEDTDQGHLVELRVMDLRGDGLGTTREIRTRRRDGGICWLSVSTIDTAASTGEHARPADGDGTRRPGASGTWFFLVDVTATHESRVTLASNEATWKILFRNLSDAVTVTDADGRIRRSSGEITEVLGYDATSWVGADALSFLHPDELPLARRLLGQILEHPGTPFRQVFRTRRGDGGWDDIEYTVINHLADPLVEGLIVITRNVTAILGAESLLAAEADVLQLIATDAPLDETMGRITDLVSEHTGTAAAVLRIDTHPTTVAAVSSTVDRLTADAFASLSTAWLTAGANQHGGEPARVTHDLRADLPFAPDTRRAVHHFEAGGAAILHVLTVSDSDARPHSVLVWLATEVADPGRHDAVAEVAGHLIEIAVERARSRASLEHAVLHHPLTRLPNRVVVTRRIEEVTALAAATGGDAAVLCIDVDRFKVVNDSLGHGAGDRLLARVAGRLRSLVTGDDLMGHFAADEFVAVLAPPTSLQAALILAEDIERVLAEPFALPEGEVYLSASIGIATTAGGDDRPAELFQHADSALARAKKLGRSRVEVFDGVLRDEATRQLHLERDLRLALDRSELAVHFQLEWDVATAAPVGAEALLRWNHPDRGPVLPDEFIEMAEETGLIRRMGRWVLEEAVRSAREWVDSVPGLDDFVVAVNVSARQLTSSDLVQSVTRVLEAYDWPATGLTIELTESVLIDELESAFEVMHELKDLGVGLALDDFGTGYSSLNYLHRFPVDLVKVDQSFVADLAADGTGSPVVAAVLQVADALGLVTVAEGVETVEQLQALRTLGCTRAQGFLLARPAPPDEVGRHLASIFAPSTGSPDRPRRSTG